jgi:flavin-binding protein dodecin
MTVARVTEITASSSKGIEAAVDEGLKRASKTLRGITGLEIVSIKAKVAKGKVQEYRVSLKITFVLEE